MKIGKATIRNLRKAASEATPGPWYSFADEYRAEEGRLPQPNLNGVGTEDDPDAIVFWTGFDASAVSNRQKRRNARFIASWNPEVALHLLHEYDDLKDEVKRLRDELDRLRPVQDGEGEG